MVIYMSNKSLRLAAVRQFDARLARLQPMRWETPPAGGWLRALRKALGMTAAQLAARLAITQSSVAALEKREADESITLERLRRAADALGCDLVYALMPRTPLARVRDRQAMAFAEMELERVDHSMRLEDQRVAAEKTRHLVRENADEFLRSWSRRIWDIPTAGK